MKRFLPILLIPSLYISSTNATYEIEVGPYEITAAQTDAYEKTDVAESEAGLPLQYILTVERNGSVVPGVRLDLWSANAEGLYSGIERDSTEDEDYLRGWQVTDEAGQIVFDAIYPGPYTDRTIHVHFRVREYDSDGVTTTYDDTTQLFFPEDVTEEVMKLSAYQQAAATSWNTVNSNDRLYVADNEVTLIGSVNTSFIATYTIELPMEVSNSTTTNPVPGDFNGTIPNNGTFPNNSTMHRPSDFRPRPINSTIPNNGTVSRDRPDHRPGNNGQKEGGRQENRGHQENGRRQENGGRQNNRRN